MRIAFLLFFLFFARVLHSCEVIDDEGNKITLPKPAMRIVSLAPDLTEILFAAGAGNRIVGVVQGSDYPPAAKKIPVVASYNQLNTEQLLALHPDLIVVWGEGILPVQIKKFSIPVFLSRQHVLQDIPQTLKRFGCLTGTHETADAAAHVFLNRYAKLKKQYSQQKKIRVFYQVWPEPLMTVTKHSWINEIILLCGGENVFADLAGAAPEVNVEAVIAANPDVIFATDQQQNWQKYWMKWQMISAVKRKNLFSVNADLIERAGPRILDGALQICRLVSKQ